jgi:CheY-like chemotaxis protein
MDGHEVLAAIKVDPELQGIPVVIMSTSSREWDIRRAYAGGATCYLVKPMSWDGYLQLAETVAAVESWRTYPSESVLKMGWINWGAGNTTSTSVPNGSE